MTVSKAASNAVAPAAKGDLVIGSGTNASTVLGVASTAGWVLTADSSTTSGLKWAAASGGMTELASGSLSSTSTAITGLSTSYYQLVIFFDGVSISGTDQPNFRFNADNGSNYYLAQNSATAGASNEAAAGGVRINANLGAASTNNQWVIVVPNYASTTSQKVGWYVCAFTNSSSVIQNIGGFFTYNSNTAITQVNFHANYGGSASFDAGTYKVYGVK